MVEQVVDELDLALPADEVAQVETGRAQQHPRAGELGNVGCLEERDAAAHPDDEPGDLGVGGIVPTDHDVLDPADLVAGLVAHDAADETCRGDQVSGDEPDGAGRARAFP